MAEPLRTIAGCEIVDTPRWPTPRYEVRGADGQRFTILAAGATGPTPAGFAERAAALSRQTSPHLARCLDHGNDPYAGSYLRFAPLSERSLHTLRPRTHAAVRDAIDGALRGVAELHRLGMIHGELTEAAFGHGETGIVLEDVFEAVLGTKPPPHDRADADLRAMGRIVYELFSGRPYDPSPEAAEPPLRSLALTAAVQTAITHTGPTRFADAEAMRNALLFALDRVERFAPRDPVEARFLDGLRVSPADVELRRVYADWLEQQGHAEQADTLRDDSLSVVGQPSTPAWRALISRAPVYGCVRYGACSWNELDPTIEDTVRRCTRCEKSVHYCTDYDEAHARVDEGMPVATDRDTMTARKPSINLIPQLPRAARIVELPRYDDVLTPYAPPGFRPSRSPPPTAPVLPPAVIRVPTFPPAATGSSPGEPVVSQELEVEPEAAGSQAEPGEPVVSQELEVEPEAVESEAERRQRIIVERQRRQRSIFGSIRDWLRRR